MIPMIQDDIFMKIDFDIMGSMRHGACPRPNDLYFKT